MAPPPSDEDGADRAAILARRALFVASAMSSFAVTRIASAQSPEPPAVAPCPVEGGDEAVAKAALARAEEAVAAGKLADAATAYGQAYAAHPTRETLLAWLGALGRAQQPDRASVAAETHIRCFGDFDELRSVMEPIIATSAHVVVLSSQGPGLLFIDGVPFDPARAKTGVLVSAGKHAASMQLADGRQAEKTFEAVAGETTTIELAPTGIPIPCLSIIQPRPGRRYRIDGGMVAPHPAFFLTSPTRTVVGAGLFVSFSGVVAGRADGQALLMSGSVFGMLLADGVVRAFPVGASIDWLYQAKGSYRCGLGIAGGYMIDSTPEEVDDGGVVQTPFIGPVATPVSFRWGIAQVELRIPLWFGLSRIDGVEAVRTLMLQPYAAISFGHGFD